MGKVRINRVKCRSCNDIIESFHEHDFKRCKCGLIFIDGGTSYQRADLAKITYNGDYKIEDYIDFGLSAYEYE